MWPMIEPPKDKMYGPPEHLIMCTPKTHVLEPDDMKLPPLKLGPKIQLRIPAETCGDSIVESPSKPSKVVRQTLSMPFPEQFGIISPLLSSDDDTLSDSSMISPVSETSSVTSCSPEISKKLLPRHFLDREDDPGLLPTSVAEEGEEDDGDLSLNLLFRNEPSAQAEDKNDDKETDSDLGEGSWPLQPAAVDESPNPLSRKRSFNGLCGEDTWKRVCQPKHCQLQPKKSSLKLQSHRLNFVMDSSNGNVKDATIFATEINSCNAYGVPFPASVLERVTIPVNTHVKEHYKKERGEYLGGYYDDDEDEKNDGDQKTAVANDTSDDSAIIRAYAFERLVTFKNEASTALGSQSGETADLTLDSPYRSSGCGAAKTVRWAPSVTW
ncbi:AaceriABR128Wp [[Ashbya] aceris (nom. inval.)]|nr:AaceriABR128Wp [[Ashbya] aceris (nom. inval.)]